MPKGIRARSLMHLLVGAMFVLCSFTALAGCNPNDIAHAQRDDAYGHPDASGSLNVLMEDSLANQRQRFDRICEDRADQFPNVGIASVRYLNQAQIEQEVSSGTDADIIFAQRETIDRLRSEGHVPTNVSGLNVAYMGLFSNVNLIIIRKAGGTVEMPDTRLLGGGEEGGTPESRLSHLDKFKGSFAICAEGTMQGRAANQALATCGYYSARSGTGGSYAESIAGKVLSAPSAAEAVQMVKGGTCDAAFVYNQDVSGDDDVEELYTVGQALYSERPVYKAAVLKSSGQKDAAHRFLYCIGQ